MELGHVVVLAGGLSYEREVSLRSGRRVADALRSVDVPVELRDADATLLDALSHNPPDAVFPVLHGAAGEDGSIRDVLELMGVPYVGARPDACRVAWDKPSAKAVARRAGLGTPASVALPKEIFHDLGASSVMEHIVRRLGLPLSVKPTRGGSALGASIVQEATELPAAMVGCFSYGDTEFVTPARLAPEATERAAQAAVTAHRALGLRDLSRTDLIVDTDGEAHFLEVNVAPGLTETSLFPLAVSAASLDLGTVCRDLLLARFP